MSFVRWPGSAVGGHLQSLAAALRGVPPIDADWDEVIRLANEHLLGPRLYRSLATSPHAEPEDREAMDYLASLDAANRERNTRLGSQLGDLVRALAAEGIAPLVLKGGAELVRSATPDQSARLSRDLDILIDPDEAPQTDRVLRACGYATFSEDPGGHSAGTYFRPCDVGAVDVHVGLPLLCAHLVTPLELSQRAQSLPFGDQTVRVPDASLQFVINLGHEMLHDEAVASGFVHLRYLIDLIDLARGTSGRLDWDWILGKCNCWKFRLGLELQARLAHHLGFAELPAPFETRLGAALHQRRLFKLAHPWVGKAEWQTVRRVKKLRHLGGTSH